MKVTDGSCTAAKSPRAGSKASGSRPADLAPVSPLHQVTDHFAVHEMETEGWSQSIRVVPASTSVGTVDGYNITVSKSRSPPAVKTSRESRACIMKVIFFDI